MIRLTRRSGEIEIVNPDRIERIVEAHADSGARIIFPDGESYPYKESPAEVARKVLEWQWAMEDYRHGEDAEIKLLALKKTVELAGLEGKGI